MHNQYRSIYLLGYTKANIEWFSWVMGKQNYEEELFNLITDFEEQFNQEIARIFSSEE